MKHFLIVAALFLFSGLSSLIYQVIWTRQLEFVFGSTTFASSTVLSAFMGGLALGSFWAGRRSDKMPNPFLCYGLLEAAIGVWALLAPFMFEAAIPIYKTVWQHIHLSTLPFSLLRFLVVALILLPPTSCMGATLPLLSRFVTDNLDQVGNRVGSLYSINSLGAVLGALLAGFLLIPSFGLSATTYSAAFINVALALVVISLCRQWHPGPADKKTAVENLHPTITDPSPMIAGPSPMIADANSQLEHPLPGSAQVVMIAFAVSGAIAMLNEVAWTRALLMVIGSTTYAFSIMLSTFLAGIFIGSLIVARFADKVKDPLFGFALVQLALCAVQLLSIHLFNYLPFWNLMANRQFQDNTNVGMYIRFLLAAVVLVPISVLLGAAFPLAIKVCARDLERVGRSVGFLYSANTLGAIIGAFAAGFLIIPLIGGQSTLIYCALANCSIGSAVMFCCAAGRRAFKLLSLVLLPVLTLWVAQKPEIWDHKWITVSQAMRRGLRDFNELTRTYEQSKKYIDANTNLLYWRDGACSNVAVIEQGGVNSLYTNGHVDASTSLDVQTQALLPTIPLLLKPGATVVAAVGWGSGATAGYSLLFPIEKVVCAEIERAVLETSHFFHSINFAPENDPRLRLEINDGRNYLLATNEKFDVIASEPSNPWQAGVCNLFSQEYFQICHDRLKPGGMFSMWCQYVEFSSDDLARILSALKHVYKHVVVFLTNTDIVAVSSDSPIKMSLPAVAEALKKNAKLRNALSRNAGIYSPEDLASRIVIADDGVDRIVRGKPAVSDDRNYIEFDVAKNYEQHQYSDENRLWMWQNGGALWETIDWTGMSKKDQAETMNQIAEREMANNSATCVLWAKQSASTYPNSHALQIIAMLEAQKIGDLKEALAVASQAVKQFPQDKQARCMRGMIELMAADRISARRDFAAALSLSPQEKIYKYRLAETYLPQPRYWYQSVARPAADTTVADTNPQKVVEILSPLLTDKAFVGENPGLLLCLAQAKLQLASTDDGINLLQRYLKDQPDDILAWQLLDLGFAKKGDHESRIQCSRRIVDLSKQLKRQ